MGKSAKNIEPLSSHVSSIDELTPASDMPGRAPPKAMDAIAGLKSRLVELHQPAQSGHRLFRLSYSILTLETCLEERGLTDISLDQSPGIQAMIRRIDDEINSLGKAAPPAPFVAVNVHQQNSSDSILPLIHQNLVHLADQLTTFQTEIRPTQDGADIVRLLGELQKGMTLDSRRHQTAQAALHAAIERLSERMTQFEATFERYYATQSTGQEAARKLTESVKDKERIDPRPMLAAARAAAARALADIDPLAIQVVTHQNRLQYPRYSVADGAFPLLQLNKMPFERHKCAP